MSGISAAAASQVDQGIILNHHLTETQGTSICASLAYNVLQKISYVALIAIGTFAFYVGSNAVPITATLAMTGIAAFLFFFWLASATSSALKESSSSCEIESHVIATLRDLREKYEKILTHSCYASVVDIAMVEKEVKPFFVKEGLDIAQIPQNVLDALSKQNPGKPPLYSLLPLIIRFEYLRDSGINSCNACKEKMSRGIEKDIQKREAELKDQSEAPLTEKQKRAYRLAMREHSHEQIEAKALIDLFEATVLRRAIQDPTFNLNLADIGYCVPKTFAERQFDLLYDPKNDDYFVFKDSKKPSITLTEVMQDPTPRTLDQKLFA